MNFDAEWKKILYKAWSVRFMGIAAFCEVVNQVVVPYFQDYGQLPPRLMSAFAGLSLVAAIAARFIVQKELSNGK